MAQYPSPEGSPAPSSPAGSGGGAAAPIPSTASSSAADVVPQTGQAAPTTSDLSLPVDHSSFAPSEFAPVGATMGQDDWSIGIPGATSSGDWWLL